MFWKMRSSSLSPPNTVFSGAGGGADADAVLMARAALRGGAGARAARRVGVLRGTAAARVRAAQRGGRRAARRGRAAARRGPDAAPGPRPPDPAAPDAPGRRPSRGGADQPAAHAPQRPQLRHALQRQVGRGSHHGAGALAAPRARRAAAAAPWGSPQIRASVRGRGGFNVVGVAPRAAAVAKEVRGGRGGVAGLAPRDSRVPAAPALPAQPPSRVPVGAEGPRRPSPPHTARRGLPRPAPPCGIDACAPPYPGGGGEGRPNPPPPHDLAALHGPHRRA
jgi:hypothetical protein